MYKTQKIEVSHRIHIRNSADLIITKKYSKNPNKSIPNHRIKISFEHYILWNVHMFVRQLTIELITYSSSYVAFLFRLAQFSSNPLCKWCTNTISYGAHIIFCRRKVRIHLFFVLRPWTCFESTTQQIPCLIINDACHNRLRIVF